MAWTDAYNPDPKWVWLTTFATFFACWLLHELLERKCGMEPTIRSVQQVNDMDRTTTGMNMSRRMSKSLDISGDYRITIRGAIFVVAAVWNLVGLFAMIATFCVFPDWWYDHFIALNAATVDFWIYQHTAGSVAAYYSWNVVANRYGKLSYSTLFHHWLTVLAAIIALFGVYIPFAVWFGLFGVFLPFPLGIALGFRSLYSNKHPDLTRSMIKYSAQWFAFMCLINYIGQIYLLTTGFYTGKVHVAACVLIMFALLGWIHDDYHLLMTLNHFATLPYEDASILNRDGRIFKKSIHADDVKYHLLISL